MASTIQGSPSGNRILASLGPAELARLEDDLELIPLLRGAELYGPGDTIEYVYFPIAGVVALNTLTAVGQTAELASTGSEGMVGICLVLGNDKAVYQAAVSDAGLAYRLRAEVMTWELAQNGDLLLRALEYSRLLMMQMAQLAVCGGHHTAEQRISRWLLAHLDRLGGNAIVRTQAEIAEALGIRRAAVNQSLGHLQAAGLVLANRGRITVTDRDGLAARACECYLALRQKEEHQTMPLAEPHPASQTRPGAKTLRQRAEARWHEERPKLANPPWDTARLVHELEVHQIELEMRHDELQRAYDETESLRKRYADIYDFSPVGFFTLDTRGVIVEVNLAGAILLGVKRSEAARHRFAASLADASREDFDRLFTEVLRSGTKQSGEFTLCPTPTRPEAVVRIEAVADEARQECRMVVLDMTAARRTEEELRRREHYQRALLDNFPFMVWLKDEQSRFLAVNTPLARNFGYPSADALIGKTDFDITTRELAEAYRADDRSVLSSGEQKLVEELIEVDGTSCWFETYKSPLELDGRRVGTVGFARDVTHRHFTQAALEESERRHRSFIENLSLAVVIAQDGVLRFVNPKAIELLGYAPEECLDRPFLPLIHEDDRSRVRAHYERRMAGEAAPRHYELRALTKGGRVIDCRIHVSVVDWGERPAALGILEDISEAKRLEAQLRAQATTDSLTELANRRQFMVRLEDAFARRQRDKTLAVGVLLLDLDHFKDINDRLGHAAGDAVLRRIAAILRNELRQVDTAGRIGGEEFAILLPGSDLAAATVFAERLRRKIASSSAAEPNLAVTVSIGIAAMEPTDTLAEDALRRSDVALYRAKAAGRNRSEEVSGGDFAKPSKTASRFAEKPASG